MQTALTPGPPAKSFAVPLPYPQACTADSQCMFPSTPRYGKRSTRSGDLRNVYPNAVSSTSSTTGSRENG